MAVRERSSTSCPHGLPAKTVGDHRGSGGCARTWIDPEDTLRHVCRASRDATQCRCPCGSVYRERDEIARANGPSEMSGVSRVESPES